MSEIKDLTNPNAKHKAIITVNVNIQGLLENGAFSGMPVKELTRTYLMSGDDQHICVRRTNELLEELKTLCS